MHKFISLFTAIVLIILTEIGVLNTSYREGYIGELPYDSIYTKIEADKLYLKKDDVTFDMSVGTYDLDGLYDFSRIIPETYKIAVYVSNSIADPFYSFDKDKYPENIEDVEGAKLIRVITYDEAFSENFGYTTKNYNIITYNHKEKITIPQEFINSDNGMVYIHIIELYCYNLPIYENKEVNGYYKKVSIDHAQWIEIEYQIFGDYMVLYWENRKEKIWKNT